MSKDKYPSIFSSQIKAIVLIVLQIFFAMRAIFKIGEYSRIFPSFSWGLSPVLAGTVLAGEYSVM